MKERRYTSHFQSVWADEGNKSKSQIYLYYIILCLYAYVGIPFLLFLQLSFLHQINQWKSCIQKSCIRIQCHPICVGCEPTKDQFICLNSPNLCGTPTNHGSMLLSLPTQYVCNLKVNIRTSRIDTTVNKSILSRTWRFFSDILSWIKRKYCLEGAKGKVKGRRSHHLEAFVCILPEGIGFKTCNT